MKIQCSHFQFKTVYFYFYKSPVSVSHPHTVTHWHCLCSLTQPSLCSLQQLPNVASKTQPFTAKPVMESFFLCITLSESDGSSQRCGRVPSCRSVIEPRELLHSSWEREDESVRQREQKIKREEIKKETEETSHRDRLHSHCTAAQQRVWFIPEFTRGELGFTISKWALIHPDSRELTSSSLFSSWLTAQGQVPMLLRKRLSEAEFTPVGPFPHRTLSRNDQLLHFTPGLSVSYYLVC